jgi:hypothetical protein
MLPITPLSHSLPRHRLLAWLLLASLPVAFVAAQIAGAARDIAYWDELATLDFVLRLDAGETLRDVVRQIVAVDSEHRTVTSRVLFALSYALTGGVNFKVMNVIGNLFLAGACGLLALSAAGAAARVRFGVVLALVVFQLEHFENFYWAGASIDHFQVVLLVVGAIVALARGTRSGLALGALAALLATFTLAHGCLAWPIGALLLAQQRRWRALAWWAAAAALALAAFLYGFTIHPSHRIGSLAEAGIALRYWLVLLGAVPALGKTAVAPALGLVLLGALGVAIARGAARREPAAVFTGVFAIGALGAVAFGRATAGAQPESRYLVLGALAWAVAVFLWLERASEARRPFRALGWAAVPLVAFNIAADIVFAAPGAGAVEIRDRAATLFQQFGEDGRGLFRLSPYQGHAERVLTTAEKRGVYRLPTLTEEKKFPRAQPNDSIIHYFDELIVNDRAITIGGWAMMPGLASKRGQIHVVLRSASGQRIFTTVSLQRPDVARAYARPEWARCGFRLTLPVEWLPRERFEIGVLLADGARADFQMTPSRLALTDTPSLERFAADQ